jgi:hypothetical protein
MHGFGDIGRMIAHTLEIFGAKHQVSAEGGGDGVFRHVDEKFLAQICAQPIDVLIPRPNVDRLGDVTAGEAVEHIPQLAQHERGHVLDAAHQHPRPLSTIDRNDAIGDVLRKIADALDLVGNPQDPNDLSKVIRYRLAPRNGLDRSFLDVVLHGIDRRIGGNYALCATGIASRQRLDRLGNLSLRQPTHLCDCSREFL